VVSQVPLSLSQILMLPSAYPLAICNQKLFLLHQQSTKIHQFRIREMVTNTVFKK